MAPLLNLRADISPLSLVHSCLENILVVVLVVMVVIVVVVVVVVVVIVFFYCHFQ